MRFSSGSSLKKNMAGTRIRNFDLTWPRFDPSPRSQGQIWLLLGLQVVTQFLKKTSFVLTELKLGLTQGGLGAYPRGWFVYPGACARQLHSTPLGPARTWSTRENRFLQKKMYFSKFQRFCLASGDCTIKQQFSERHAIAVKATDKKFYSAGPWTPYPLLY